MVVFPMESRVADTPALLRLVAEAGRYDFNRQLDEETLGYLDPDGWHVLTVYVPDHHRMRLPGDENLPPDPYHHRCRVLLKLRGDSEPFAGWLDVTQADWETLEVPQAKAQR